MSLLIKATIKEKGEIAWPAVGEPEFPEGEDGRAKRREWLREQITAAAEDTRAALHAYPHARVYVRISFRPDIMVDPA